MTARTCPPVPTVLRDALLATQRRIAEWQTQGDLDVGLVFGAPVDPDDVALAEALLGVALPDDYVALLCSLGPYKIADAFASKRRSFELLTPLLLVEETERFRALAQTVNPEVAALSQKTAILQFSLSPVDFYLLEIADGTITSNTHDAVSSQVHRSFLDHTLSVLSSIESWLQPPSTDAR